MSDEMSEAEQEIADKHVCRSWDLFVKNGGLEAIARELGPMGEYEKRIFEAGFKFGFLDCLEQGHMMHVRMGGARL